MRPISLSLPKPLVRIGGKAMLDHVLDRLEEAGVSQAIVNVHWLADQIEDHLKGRSAPGITISDERELLLDQGGAIVKVLDEFGGKPFFICNTDLDGSTSRSRRSRGSPAPGTARKWTCCCCLPT